MYGAAQALQPLQLTPPHCPHCEATQPVAEVVADELVRVLLLVETAAVCSVVEVVVCTVVLVVALLGPVVWSMIVEVRVVVLRVVETGLLEVVLLLGPGSGTESEGC